ncbi:mannosyltransferase putative-domain-containing protein [Chytriomyces sp. MP71]|nr:mannosyltransferase putative-domain-containing protein [Chytriomyces sp. MP71]
MHSAAEEAKESVGLVLTGGSRHFYMLSHLILSLRREWNISLPVEVFYAGPGDMNEEMVASLNTIPGVKALDLTKFFPERTKGMGGWSVKPYAMLASSFQTVLFVDADVLFFQSPLLALESSAYRETGLLFFQDRFYRDETSQNTPKLFNRMNRHVSNYAKSMRFTNALTWDLTAGTYKMDSGFVVMDKGRLGNLFALLLTAKMNTWPEVETLHAETYGDKESFFFATEALRTPYKFNPGYGGALGHEEPTENPDFGRVCGIYLLQLDENENLFWWNGGGVLVDRYRTSNFSGEAWARFSQVGLDVDGLGTIWKDFCIVRPKNNVRNLTDTEQALLERYRDIFRKDLEGLGLKP